MTPRTHAVIASLICAAIVPIGTLHAMRATMREPYLDMKEGQMQRVERVAERLGRRVERRFGETLSLDILIAAVRSRTDILNRNAVVRFYTKTTSDKTMIAEWNVTMQRYPLWVRFSIEDEQASFDVDADAIRASINAGEPYGLKRPVDALLRNIQTDRRILRGEPVGRPDAGYTFDTEDAAERISAVFKGDEDGTIDIGVEYTEPKLYVVTGSGTKMLTRLSSGKSNFEYSPWGRMFNIKKALNERINGAVVKPNEVFSFNDALIGAYGWKDALVIVNGKDLVLEPGGGICQVATTAYRAAVLAGLPVTERKSHSLYVTYYKKYGVGIDATVYAKKQDMKFHNDTDDDIVLLAHTEGNEAYIDLFGSVDGRTVDLDGPFFAETAPEELLVNGRKPRSNEIIWKRTVGYPDGKSFSEIILSQYQSLPRKLHTEYPESRGINELTGTYAATGSVLPIMLSAIEGMF